MGKRKRINDLGTVEGLNVQMRQIYRAARRNTPDEMLEPSNAKVMIDILRIITTNYRDSELELRIKALEDERFRKST